MSAKAPDWLSDFQASFGRVLRAPLVTADGRLRSDFTALDEARISQLPAAAGAPARERLGVYNQQYWFRLFTAMQRSFPLTTGLLGAWQFNRVAAVFLTEHPPTSWDIQRVGDGFERFLESSKIPAAKLPGADLHAISQAASIDATYVRLFQTPRLRPFRPGELAPGDLASLHLLPSPSWAVVEEHWPWIELRHKLSNPPTQQPVPWPTRLPATQYWLLYRKHTSIGELRIGELERRLFELLGQHSVGRALACIELSCSEPERERLPAWVQHWLSRSLELQMWRDPE